MASGIAMAPSWGYSFGTIAAMDFEGTCDGLRRSAGARRMNMIRYTGNATLLALLVGACIGACSDGGSEAGGTPPMMPPVTASNPVMANQPGAPTTAPGAGSPATPGPASMTPTPAAPSAPGAIAGSSGAETAMAGGAGSVPPAAGGPDELLEGSCPEGYEVKPGFNMDFPSADLMRAFYVIPPADTTKPMAVWVPLTGTEESTQQNLEVLRSGNNQAVAEGGYMVLGPVRICANQDPMVTNQRCSGAGPEPYMYIPWRDGASMRHTTDEPVYKEEGPDSEFFVDMVKCVAASYPILKRKLYVGGISAGGSMTHRALTFRSDFWAGGVPISGEYRVSAEDGTVISGNQSESQMQGDPDGVYPGRTPPFPLPTLGGMVVVTIRGGDNDTWPGTFYKPDAQAASNYYASQADVVSVVCLGNWGHQWPKDSGNPEWTNLFNMWVVDLMASHPKGTPPSEFKLTDPPQGAGFSCKIGRFDTLYGS
jgi:hypothetical protein